MVIPMAFGENAAVLTPWHKPMTVLSHRHGPQWILEGDIKACFDKISHEWLLTHVPMDRQVLRKWLNAGFLEKHAWFATTEGTPQGGCISPALANWTLDGLQRLLAEHFAKTLKQQGMNKVHLVRYADDFLITGTSKGLLRDQVQPLVAHFLKQRGLELSHEKTQITHVEEGFDFLGQNVRRYRGGKVLLKPSSRNVKTFVVRPKTGQVHNGMPGHFGGAPACTHAVGLHRSSRSASSWTS